MNPNLSPALNTHVAAIATDAPDEATEAAQRKLETRLARPRPARAPRQWIGWTAATASACLLLALVMLPTSRGIAFDVVQKHLRDFNTLSLVIEQTSQGIALPGIHVRMNRRGDVRTDVGEASSTIVSPRNHAMLTLLPLAHKAMALPLQGSSIGHAGDNLAWLDVIRRFQGQAKSLPGSRIIDGRRTTGWVLDAEGMHIVLWADADGLPLAVDVNNGQVLSQRMHVTIDAPMDASVFSTSPPPGYSLMSGDGD